MPWFCQHRDHLPWSLGSSGALSQSNLGACCHTAVIGFLWVSAANAGGELHPVLAAAAARGILQLCPS